MRTFFKYSNILALLGIIAGFIIYFLAEKKKELTLYTNSFISLVDKNSLSGSGIKVSFDSVPVTNLYKVNFSLINTGDVAVTKSDLIDKIKIKFDPKATLLKYEIKSYPITIKIEDENSKNEIEINPDLLNPSDRIDFITYYTLNKEGCLPQTDSRIIDGKIIIKNLVNEIETDRKFKIINTPVGETLFWYMVIWNIAIFIMITWAIFRDKENPKWAKITGYIIFGGGNVLTMIYIYGKEFL
ncbi:hypothetical protein [Flavobacterium ustbae]|uniref:hypothetical protein n=1 Tax=Flavobacterium ustbae TaxID=2488790 RepID=UPI000F7A6B04|nr:hypothetical protein [Flavobacterium ustbae]